MWPEKFKIMGVSWQTPEDYVEITKTDLVYAPESLDEVEAFIRSLSEVPGVQVHMPIMLDYFDCDVVYEIRRRPQPAICITTLPQTRVDFEYTPSTQTGFEDA